jgi:hypothetical protein
MTDKVKLQLGDIIQIIAPNDKDLNEHICYIVYIDSYKIRLEEADGSEKILTFTDGNLDNESIESIKIKSRAEVNGYARQNNLLNGVWIDIHFSGDLPLTLTGQITNLEEDKIEVTTFPNKDVIFIDFGYNGLPEDMKIQIRKAPDVSISERGQAPATAAPATAAPATAAPATAAPATAAPATAAPATAAPATELAQDSIEQLEKRQREIQNLLLEMPEEEITNENLEYEKQKEIEQQTRNYIFDADQMIFGETLEAITQMVDVPEGEQRYDIDKQMDDLLDDMLSTIPNAKRTDLVKNNVHKMIQRFKQLRENFSIFDEKGYALMPKAHGPNYKPLIGVMEKLEQQLYWMLPVVKTIKKIYNISEEEEAEAIVNMGSDDTEFISFYDDLAAIKTIVDNYEQNSTTNETNKYALLQKRLNPYLTPFLETEEKEDILISVQVNTNITAVVDNLNNFNSSVQGADTFTSPHHPKKDKRKRKINEKRFALQTYTVGSSGLEITKVRGDNPIIKRKELTKNDRLDLNSILTLPEPTVRFSRVNLHTTTILEKSNLNIHFLNYWQLLKDSAAVKTTTINDMDKPYNHTTETFLKSIQHFAVKNANENEPNKENYAKFLDIIIPKTKLLFELIKPYLGGNLSINDILTYLEPFMIYQEDLNAAQYKEMSTYISEKILEYRKKYGAKSRDYTNIKGTQNVNVPSLIKILDENANLRTKVLDVYGFSDTIMTANNADIVNRINAIDDGVFYNNAIAHISKNLMIADGTRDMVDIDMYLNAQKQDKAAKATAKETATGAKSKKTVVNDEEIAALQSCDKFKVIAKRYIELDELNEDSGKEIFFDKKYDTTNYDIGKADSTLPNNEQIQYYIGKLIKTKGLDEINARREAESIMKGRRTVEDGEYAILETTDETSATIQYYVRKNENWVLDNTIDSETFADNMKMFCNMNEKCIAVKNQCDDQNTGANEIKKHNLNLILAEFNTVLNVNKDMITSKIEDELNRANDRIDILRNLRQVKMYKYETKKMEIANTAEETTKIIVSPYDGLLNTITALRQTDIAKYYLKISEFVKAFTREGLSENDESHYWLYCSKSSKKLLPTFIYKLATTFLTGGNFVQMLDKICALQGTISDDGDKYVDKYSGYTIKMIEMNTDEEYNEEGFKIITSAVMENDVGDDITDALKATQAQAQAQGQAQGQGQRKYATPDATAIYNVVETLATNMGINIEDQKDFIVRNVLKQMTNTSVIPTKAAYEKIYAMLTSKGKPADTYQDTYNSTLLYLTFAYYLIAIQTSIPPIKTKTTFPGCKKSFSGFPLDADTTNMTGLNYIACVAFKVKNKGALPWSAISNRSATYLAKQMEAFITKYILQTEEVQNEIKTLHVYTAENPVSNIIPTEHTIENWANFLPPLKKLKMTVGQDVGDVFKTRLVESLRKGNKVQADYMAELHSKMIMFSFNIIDLIEKTVHGEHALLNGKNGEPFVQNACCDVGEKNTIRYFIKKQPEIAILNNKVVRLSDMYDDTKRLSKAVFLYDPSNTKRKLREIENNFSENTIYRAFIVYCRFNSLLPITDNLKAICPTKPDNFDLNDSLDESIRKLKGSARNYSEQSLQQLLEVINTSTKTTINVQDRMVDNTSKLSEIMAKIDAENKRPSVFRAAFMDIIETFEINALMEDTAQLRKFKNILANLNDDMLGQITTFIGNFNTNAKKNDLKAFQECLKTITQFKETGNNLILGSKEETGYKMINFMKKSLRSLTCEFPNIIINEVNNDSVVIPAQWDLSQKHQGDVKEIIKSHYSEFKVFYSDSQIQLLMRKMVEMTGDINNLAQNTLFYAPVELKNKPKSANAEGASVSASPTTFKYSAFDLDLTDLLFKFYFFNVLTDLITLQTDKDILGLPLKNLESETEGDDESFISKANDMDILTGNQTELGEKIAKIIVVFTNFICKDKSAIDYNYKSLMELILRSKEKEKDEITGYLGKMTVEERAVENLFKKNKLGRWSKGEQKGIHTYQGETYDEEREDMEKIAKQEARLNKRSVVTDMNRDIFRLDMLADEAADADQEREDNVINYMGEDAEPEEYGMDGDEYF